MSKRLVAADRGGLLPCGPFAVSRSLLTALLAFGLVAAGCTSSDSGSEGEDATEGDTALPDAGEGDTALPDAGEGDTGSTDPVCGDGVCNGDETCATCPQDCGECPPECGDGVCGDGEDCDNCPADCGCEAGQLCDAGECVADPCGDGVCDAAAGETCETCPADCGACPTCGDGTCDEGEDCESCPADCGCGADEKCAEGECVPDTCGDGVCDEREGETCATCPEDCGACPPECGDGECNGDETCETCPEDCGACPEPECGDGECNGDETCESCPEDCGVCPACDLGSTLPAAPQGTLCQVFGCEGETIDCPVVMVRQTQNQLVGSALQFKAQYQTGALTLVNLFADKCGSGDCFEAPLTGPDAQTLDSGHSFLTLPGDPADWNGEVNAVVSNFASTTSALSEAYLDASGNVVGNGKVFFARFELSQDIKREDAVAFRIPFAQSPGNLVVTAPTLQTLSSQVSSGRIVTGSPVQ